MRFCGTATRRDFPRKRLCRSLVRSRSLTPLIALLSIIAPCEEDTRAESSVVSRESRLRTWARLYFCWFDDTVGAFRLTPGKIRAVSLLFKHNRCCSGMAYTSVTRCLSRTTLRISTEKADRSILRGIGPPARRSSPLPLDELASLLQADEPWPPDGPVALRTHLSSLSDFGRSKQQQSFVRTFKAGKKGKGAQRTHGRSCVASSELSSPPLTSPCPFSRRGPSARSRRCPRCQASHSQSY